MRTILVALVGVLGAFCVVCAAQQTPTTAAATTTSAATLAAQYAAVLTGGTSVADATLSGTATLLTDSGDKVGTFMMKARGQGKSRLDLAISGVTRSEIHNADSDPRCVRITPDGTVHPEPDSNCWGDAAWFFPALSTIVFSSDATLAFTSFGAETHNGTAVLHLRSNRTGLNGTPTALKYIANASRVDYYFDATSYLPVAATFTFHPAADTNVTIPVEIRFSNYQTISGIRIPFHIQRYESGVLALDLTVTSAAVNAGLQDADFIAQ